MTRLQSLALPAYLISACLVLTPLLDTGPSAFPPRFGEVAWRFGAVGVFSRTLMIPLLGVLVAFTVALLLEHGRVQRAISILSGATMVVLIAVVGLFALDALQMRAQVPPAARLAFDVSSVAALGKYGLGILALSAFALSGWKASRQESRSRSRREGEPREPGRLALIMGNRRRSRAMTE